jgi:hypothetical protein
MQGGVRKAHDVFACQFGFNGFLFRALGNFDL